MLPSVVVFVSRNREIAVVNIDINHETEHIKGDILC